jgi:hypothetical protein
MIWEVLKMSLLYSKAMEAFQKDAKRQYEFQKKSKSKAK